MSLLVLLIVLALVFGVGGHAYGGPAWGGGGLGTVLVIILILWLLGVI